MFVAISLLFTLPLAVVGHVHVSGIPVRIENHYNRLFDPIDPNFCNAQAQQSPVSCLKANAQGTPYCSSFLNIPTATVCTTATVSAVIGTTTINKDFLTTTDSPLKQARAAWIGQPSNTVAPRHVLVPRQLDGCFPAGQASTYSGSICSCLNIPTSTITTTFYFTPPGSLATRYVTVITTPAPLSTSTITFGGIGFTSTVTTTIDSVPTQIVVVSIPVTPFHIYITDSNGNVYGYLQVNNAPVSESLFNVSASDYASSSLFYYGQDTGQLTLSPLSGISPTPLISVQQKGLTTSPLLFDQIPSTNAGINASSYSDGTMRLVNVQTSEGIASLCNGLLYLGSGAPSGCVQVVLSPVYNAVNYTTVTATSGTVSSTRTYGPAGTFVSSGGTVTNIVPVVPPSTTTITSGIVGYTSLISTTINNIATQIVVANIPQPSTTTITSGSAGYTSLVSTTINNIATQIVVANIPQPSTITITSGSVAYTLLIPTIINNVATQIVVVGVPQPSTTTITSGSVAYTSLIPTIVNNVATQIVVVGVPQPSTTTITSGTVAYTSLIPTIINNIATQIVVVGVAQPLSTTTVYSGTVAFTSTVLTTVNNLPTQIAVVGVAISPFHVFITDLNNNAYGYLQTNSAVTSGTAYNVTVGTYAASSLFYINPNNGQLGLSYLSSPTPATPLYSVQQSGTTNGPFLFSANQANVNTPVTAGYRPDGTMNLVNSVNGQNLAFLCNGYLYIGNGSIAGCTQVNLSPVYDAVNYTTTTVTSGTISSTRTNAPAGTFVSQGGTVTNIVPATLYQTSGSVAYTTTTSGAAYTGTVVNVPAAPYCTGTYGYNNTGYSSGSNAGILYAIWDQPWFRQASLAIRMNYLANLSDPFFWGQTNRIGLAYPNPLNNVQLYSDTRSLNLAAVNVMHIGYLYARISGSYVFATTGNTDDIAYLWVGSNAVAGFTNSNPNFVVYNTQPVVSYTITLSAGTYTPFRLFWGNTITTGNLQFTITGPDGLQLLNSTGSTDIVVQPCSGAITSTPLFTPLTPACGSGLSYQGYSNPIQCPNNCAPDTTGYNNFNPSVFNANSSLLPIFHGVSTGTYEPSFSLSTGIGSVYGMASMDLTRAAIVYRGYFVPPSTGSYTFSLPYGSTADDVVYLWSGYDSSSTWVSWSGTNHVMRSTYFIPTAVGAATNIITFTFTATAGVYIPVTILWANAAQGGGFSLTTTFPNRTSVSRMAGLFLSQGCVQR